MAKTKPLSNCLGSALQGAALFTSRNSPEPVGVRLSFDPGGRVLILNWGDEIVVDSQPPRDAAPGDLVANSVEKE